MSSSTATRPKNADRDRLVAALEKAGAEVSGQTVRCPFHDDQTPSGSIHQDTDGTWMYTCHGPECGWNRGKRSGTAAAVAKRARRQSNAKPTRSSRTSKPKGRAKSERRPSTTAVAPANDDLRAAKQRADDAHTRLMSDPQALEYLFKTRGIDKTTAERFGLGIDTHRERLFWTMPITTPGGDFVAIKFHRVAGGYPKSRWQPSGGGRDHVWPVFLDPPGPVWLCPGELKALAVASVGRAAVGITSGETAKLPTYVLDIVRGRDVAITADDDDPGRAWADRALTTLTDAGISAWIVDLDLDASSDLKDIGDWVTRRLVDVGDDPAAVAAALDHRYRVSDPWFGTQIGDIWKAERTWQPATVISTGLKDLDSVLAGGLRTQTVTLIAGKTGHAKSQLAVTTSVNVARAGVPVGFFSLELGADVVSQLVAAQIAGVPRRELARGRVRGMRGKKLASALTEHGKMPLWVLDDERWDAGLDRDYLAELVAEGVERFGWRVVAVDYTGLLASPESDRSDYHADLLNSTAMRRIARKNDVALLAVMAVRKTQATKTKTPKEITLDDVAGAGRLVYDATNVLYVWREMGDGDAGVVHVRPLKLRYAPLQDDTDVSLRWHPKTGLIENLDTTREAAS